MVVVGADGALCGLFSLTCLLNGGGKMAGDLLIPYAKNFRGDYVSPDNAAQSDTDYYCPQCGENVILRDGIKKRAHFAHKPESLCTGESIEHIVSKEWLRLAALDTKVKRLTGICCSGCGNRRDLIFPSAFQMATVETEWINNRRPDVMLHTISKKIAVEIYQSHAVDDDKAADLCGYPWIEISAQSILRNPYLWECTQSNLIVDCEVCAYSKKALDRIAKLVGPLPENCKLITCAHCHRETTFLTGQIRGFYPVSGFVHMYKDKSIRVVRNRCLHCGSAQPETYPSLNSMLWSARYLGPTTKFSFSR